MQKVQKSLEGGTITPAVELAGFKRSC